MLKLSEWRRAKGYSQAKMAEILNISTNGYANLEHDPQKIRIGMANQIAEIFGVSLADIIFLP